MAARRAHQGSAHLSLEQPGSHNRVQLPTCPPSNSCGPIAKARVPLQSVPNITEPNACYHGLGLANRYVALCTVEHVMGRYGYKHAKEQGRPRQWLHNDRKAVQGNSGLLPPTLTHVRTAARPSTKLTETVEPKEPSQDHWRALWTGARDSQTGKKKERSRKPQKEVQAVVGALYESTSPDTRKDMDWVRFRHLCYREDW